MAENYFTPESAWRHLYIVEGMTADEFYTDSGWKLNIEQLTFLELKRSGYERIIFYDRDNKLYCYDDESYRLLSGRRTGDHRTGQRPARRGGLGKGGRGTVVGGSTKKETTTTPAPEENDRQEDPIWGSGKWSHLPMKRVDGGPLHLGIMNEQAVAAQINGYIMDSKIKTAVIINDTEDYLREFGQSLAHNMTAGYERLDSRNRNIVVFLYTDSHLANFHKDTEQYESEMDYNLILVGCPNAVELRNMLWFFKEVKGLNIRASDITPAALALSQAIHQEEKQVRIKELYTRLESFGQKERLTPDGCYALLGTKKPTPAKEQLDSLIGMKTVKDALAAYDVGEHDPMQLMPYYTASRLQPDLPMPNNLKKDEMIHFVLTGNPGTGKTTVAKLIGQLFYEMGYLETSHVEETNRTHLVGDVVGATAIKTTDCVMRAMGGVLFIDEAYTLKRSKEVEGDFGQEAIDTLVKLMDQYKGKFIVVAAGYEQEMKVFMDSNPGLARRFRPLHLEDYTPEEMQQILELTVRRAKMAFSEEFRASLPDFCENWVNLAGENWGNAGEAVNLVDSMARAWKKDPRKTHVLGENGEQLGLLELRYLPESLRENLKPVSQMREEALNHLNSMTGLSKVKEEVERLRRRMISGDMTVPGNYIFAGNPGTGKTTVARYMGQILRNLGLLKRGHLVEYTASDLISTVFNRENGGDFNKVAQRALDGVFFIDEAYQLAQSEGGRAILNILLPYMENTPNICIICAGYEDEMAEMVDYNPGFASRFAAIIHFENYTAAELHQILLGMLKQQGKETTPGYRENALRALTRYVELHGKEKDFGNARYIRSEFLPASLDIQTDRLIREHGEDFDRELKKLLTGEDIPADLVRFIREPLAKPDTRTAAEKVDALIGFGKVKEELHHLLDNAEFNRNNQFGIMGMKERLHWVLEGNPGTGKTMIAKLIGQVYKECGILPKGHTVKVTRADLVAGYEGQTAEKTRRCIEKAMGGVLFIDEAYELTRVEGGEGGFGQEAIGELVEAMEHYNGEFAVVCAGYPNDMEDFLRANSGLSSRMKKFVLEDYTPAELTQIFLRKCRAEKARPDDQLAERLEVLLGNMKARESKLRDWGNGREVENLLRDMLSLWNRDQVVGQDEEGRPIRLLTLNHVPESKQRYLKGKKKQTEQKRSAMDEINGLIGFDQLKEKLAGLLKLGETARAEGMEELLDDLNFHWVLEGNPGTGKTTVAELVGKVYREMGLLTRGHTVKVTRADLVAGYVGQTAIQTKKKIEEAMGGVLFIDEAYMLKREGSSGNDYGQEAIDTILEAMSDRNGEFAVIAAGYPREMEVFLDANPGFRSRFGQTFLLKDYTAEELTRIFALKCKKKNAVLSEDLRPVIEPLFRNMIRLRSKGWANGREAENLEKALRQMWGEAPETVIDREGVKRVLYTLRHLPEKYRKFLPDRETPTAEQPGTKQASGKTRPDEGPDRVAEEDRLNLPRKMLGQPRKDYSYDRDFAEQVKGVVLIRGFCGQGSGSGSGSFITTDGYILTCSHVVNGMDKLQARLTLDDGKVEWQDAAVVWNDPKKDFAILKIKDGSYPALAMRPLDEQTRTGESIYHWGFPFGSSLSDDLNELNPSLYQGYVSSIQKKNGLDRINTNMEAKRGCSGGPVFSKTEGVIVGILCGSQTEGDQQLMEEINFVLPVRYVWEDVVEALGAEPEPKQ